jgi:hypothetical protein
LYAEDADMFLSSAWPTIGLLELFAYSIFMSTGRKIHIRFAQEEYSIIKKKKSMEEQGIQIYYGDALDVWYIISTKTEYTCAAMCPFDSNPDIQFLQISSDTQRITHMIQYVCSLIQNETFVYTECGRRERASILAWMYKIQNKNPSYRIHYPPMLEWLEIQEYEKSQNNTYEYPFTKAGEEEEEEEEGKKEESEGNKYKKRKQNEKEYQENEQETILKLISNWEKYENNIQNLKHVHVYPFMSFKKTVGGLRISRILQQICKNHTIFPYNQNQECVKIELHIPNSYQNTHKSFLNFANMSVYTLKRSYPDHFFTRYMSDFVLSLHTYNEEYIKLIYPGVYSNPHIVEGFANNLQNRLKFLSNLPLESGLCWICNNPVHSQFSLCYSCIHEHLHFFFYASSCNSQLPRFAYAPNKVFICHSSCWTSKKELQLISYEKIKDYILYISQKTCPLFYAIYENIVEFILYATTQNSTQQYYTTHNTFIRVRQRLRRGLIQTTMRLWYLFCNRFSLSSLSVSHRNHYLFLHDVRHRYLTYFSDILLIHPTILREKWFQFANYAHDMNKYTYFLNLKGQTLENINMKEISATHDHPMQTNTSIDMMFIQMLIVQYKVEILFKIKDKTDLILFTRKKERTRICVQYDLESRMIVTDSVLKYVEYKNCLLYSYNIEQGIFSYDLYENIQKAMETQTVSNFI